MNPRTFFQTSLKRNDNILIIPLCTMIDQIIKPDHQTDITVQCLPLKSGTLVTLALSFWVIDALKIWIYAPKFSPRNQNFSALLPSYDQITAKYT